MRTHFSRVKDCVLVAVQRRDAGRATHETLFIKQKMREEKTALKSGSSPLALLSFPKLLTPLRLYAKAVRCFYSARIAIGQFAGSAWQ